MIVKLMTKLRSTATLKNITLIIGSLKRDPKRRNMLSHINIKLFI
jgi:hypothetical protein